jgi:hypothetical protein
MLNTARLSSEQASERETSMTTAKKSPLEAGTYSILPQPESGFVDVVYRIASFPE